MIYFFPAKDDTNGFWNQSLVGWDKCLSSTPSCGQNMWVEKNLQKIECFKSACHMSYA